jgi:hypothetical protein
LFLGFHTYGGVLFGFQSCIPECDQHHFLLVLLSIFSAKFFTYSNFFLFNCTLDRRWHDMLQVGKHDPGMALKKPANAQ